MPQSKPAEGAPKAIRLADYTVPAFLIEHTELDFDIHEGRTEVRSRMRMRRNPAAATPNAPLLLDGQELETQELRLDGQELAAARYTIGEEQLRIDDLPAAFELETWVTIVPEQNTALEGLYKSGSFYCTQCEAEGFRRITWFLDRPDVLSTFRVTVRADRARYPVLLANGNPIAAGEEGMDRHYATWEDPFPKPSYLFALVCGDLEHIAATHTTPEGREVQLRIYTTAENVDKCDFAMQSLIRSMIWDEQTFGLACDLDHYNIVVTDDFNMGAMENKGLNIFNSKYVLARPETASDGDFAGIEGVIGHEYFHNWTGNRVTCRDWFQLSLKEGLTVFRDQEFSADMQSRAIKRIEDVRLLRTHQFKEDAGPMAHPVRPAEVIEINNFYTVTVYEKGAEVVRMYHTLLGAAGFRKGMDLYFARHDGQAVTCDDFRAAMADANGRDLSQFENWYRQAGTPILDLEARFDADTQTLHLSFRQSCPPTPGLQNDAPFHIPIALGLLDAAGQSLPVRLAADAEGCTTAILEMREREQDFVCHGLEAMPALSVLRGFSAPVKLRYEQSPEQLAFLLAHDPDAFCRWDAGQKLQLRILLELVAAQQTGRELELPALLRDAFARVLAQAGDDQALAAELLSLPGESFVGDQLEVDDPDAVHSARSFLRRALGTALLPAFRQTFEACRSDSPYVFDAENAARRSLQGVCLGYLMAAGQGEDLAVAQFETADNMTERMSALANLCHHEAPRAAAALDSFYQQWQQDSLVIDKWFAVQASLPGAQTLSRVRELMEHPAFSLKKPNKVRALIGAFCGQNRVGFHNQDGSGYRFLREQIITLDPLNPQIAARMASLFNHWRRFDPQRQDLMRSELEGIVATSPLSRDVYEICSKALASS